MIKKLLSSAQSLIVHLRASLFSIFSFGQKVLAKNKVHTGVLLKKWQKIKIFVSVILLTMIFSACGPQTEQNKQDIAELKKQIEAIKKDTDELHKNTKQYLELVSPEHWQEDTITKYELPVTDYHELNGQQLAILAQLSFYGEEMTEEEIIEVKKVFVEAIPVEEEVNIEEIELDPGTFQKSVNESEGYSGDVYLLGYAEQEIRQEGFCEENCAEFNYVFFHFLKAGETPGFKDFMQENIGNSFLKADAVALGCLENGVIKYDNAFTHEDGSAELARHEINDGIKAILSSTEENPVILHLTKDMLKDGASVMDCYSHFTEIELAEGVEEEYEEDITESEILTNEIN